MNEGKWRVRCLEDEMPEVTSWPELLRPDGSEFCRVPYDRKPEIEEIAAALNECEALRADLAAAYARIAELEAALKWYGESAEAINRYMKERRHTPLEAVVTALELDAGKRASEAIGAAP